MAVPDPGPGQRVGCILEQSLPCYESPRIVRRSSLFLPTDGWWTRLLVG